MAEAGLTLSVPTLDALSITAAFLLAAVARFVLRSPAAPWQRVLRDTVEYVGLFCSISLLGAVASYAVAATSTGFADRSLETFDHILRFDWVRWYDFEVAHPALVPVSRIAYQSIFVTPAILLGYFAFQGRKAEARWFIASFWLAAVITLLLFTCFPAQGPLGFLWHGPIPYMPTSAMYQVDLIPALRDHAIRAVPLVGLHGLVSAPSFHTVSAVLYIAAAWPIARLRWPILLLNAAMLLATPVEGTHYLTDMIVGALVALATLATMMLLAPRFVPAYRAG